MGKFRNYGRLRRNGVVRVQTAYNYAQIVMVSIPADDSSGQEVAVVSVHDVRSLYNIFMKRLSSLSAMSCVGVVTFYQHSNGRRIEVES